MACQEKDHMAYEIPATLASELDELDGYIAKHLRGELGAAELKARRVPYGCYEQRRDGSYMVRIRTTGGALTPRQLRTIAEISSRYGSGSIHITTRQEFQVHDVTLENVTRVMRELLQTGLASRGGGGNTVRNLLLSPDAGVAVDEVFDPSPYAFALTTRLIAEEDSWLLPRKFKISFSNSPADTGYAQFNDVGFITEIRDGVKGFRVYVAGGLGTKPEVGHLLHDFIPDTDVYIVTSSVKRLFDQNGNRKNRHAARLRFLWRTVGEARFRELYEEQVAILRAQNPAPLTLHDEPQASTLPPFAPIRVSSPEFEQWKHRYVELQKQPSLVSILLPVFLGNLKNEDAIRLADVLAPFGDFTLRASFSQNLRLRNIPESYLGNVYELLHDISSLAQGPRLLANSISCTGADTCQLGICLPKGALTATVDKLQHSTLDLDAIPDFRLNLSGCPNTCGQHMLADLGFFGNVGRRGEEMFPAYNVVSGARIGGGDARLAQQTVRVNAHDLPAFVHDVLEAWLQKKERFVSFSKYVDGEGLQDLRLIADKYREIPSIEEDRSYYIDWSAKELFSLAGKGLGECAAGLFDLIEVDLKQAASLRDSGASDALYTIALCSARALLITQGVEAHSDEAVFESFRKHFLLTGLIDARFELVITAAQQHDTSTLNRHQADVSALLDAVNALYKSLDNSLRFTAPKQ
jgi:sulfite reductase (ferredoxin)